MRNALLVIDVQESFRPRPNWSTISNPGITRTVDRLVKAARAQNDLVIWVLHSEPGLRQGSDMTVVTGWVGTLLIMVV